MGRKLLANLTTTKLFLIVQARTTSEPGRCAAKRLNMSDIQLCYSGHCHVPGIRLPIFMIFAEDS